MKGSSPGWQTASVTSGIQLSQVCGGPRGPRRPGLPNRTLHLAASPALLAAQREVARASEGPVRILLGAGRVGQGRAVLQPGDGHLLREEAFQVAGEGERTVGPWRRDG